MAGGQADPSASKMRVMIDPSTVPSKFSGKDADAARPLLSVIIPSRERPAEIAGCLRALAHQTFVGPYEVIVVDDSPTQTLSLPQKVPSSTRIVRSGGRGPAFARNVGAASATAETFVFTDDDTVPDRNWLDAVNEHFRCHPLHLGVEGPTTSPPFDPLTEHSIDSDVAGAYFTCNVAYRKEAFVASGGFYEGFPYAHCEDLDLGFRLARSGEIGFAPDMKVVHPPRSVAALHEIRRARITASEVLLRDRHPALYLDYLWFPRFSRPVIGLARGQLRMLRRGHVRALASPRRFARWALVTAGKIVVASIACVRCSRGDTV